MIFLRRSDECTLVSMISPILCGAMHQKPRHSNSQRKHDDRTHKMKTAIPTKTKLVHLLRSITTVNHFGAIVLPSLILTFIDRSKVTTARSFPINNHIQKSFISSSTFMMSSNAKSNDSNTKATSPWGGTHIPDDPNEVYVPPKVWKWEHPDPESVNRPTAGARYQQDLPVGKHPLQLYSMGTPNGQKVTIMLEELLEAGHTGAEYDAWLIKIINKEQFSSGFVKANPNSKIPVLVDKSGQDDINVFETGSILLYLAEKFDNAFFPTDPLKRAQTLNWLFWNVGSGPYGTF
jgi:hypothetical protein